MVEKKRRYVANDATKSVKLTETANTVDSLAVLAEDLSGPANIQALSPRADRKRDALGA